MKKGDIVRLIPRLRVACKTLHGCVLWLASGDEYVFVQWEDGRGPPGLPELVDDLEVVDPVSLLARLAGSEHGGSRKSSL
jgi:hypothetical protein